MQNKTIGIYLITEKATGKMYVGLSRAGIEGRWARHKKKSFPEALFSYEILHPCPPGTTKAELSLLEKFYIRELGCMSPNGFNRTSGGCGKTELSKETRERMKIASTGRKLSEEAKKKLSVNRTGMKLSEEHKKKSVAALEKSRHMPRSEEARANMSAAQKASWEERVISEETRKKLASGRKGKVGPNKGKKFSEEHRKNIAEANRRKAPKSEETRKKQSESLKARLALKRAEKAAEIAALETAHTLQSEGNPDEG